MKLTRLPGLLILPIVLSLLTACSDDKKNTTSEYPAASAGPRAGEKCVTVDVSALVQAYAAVNVSVCCDGARACRAVCAADAATNR